MILWLQGGKNRFICSILLTLLTFGSCTIEHKETDGSLPFLNQQIPEEDPIPFLPTLVEEDLLIHRGIFSTDLKAYYYTVSDKTFSKFDVKVIHQKAGKWSEPQDAFFNSKYSDHGMSFAPDGNTLLFSSTRPVNITGIADTWHLWKSEKKASGWSEPEFIDIPNLRDQLVSHPSIDQEGTLYFHSSNIDYSKMDLYFAPQKEGVFQNAQKVKLVNTRPAGNCTPFISPDGRYLLFATIGEQLDLNICYKKGENEWSPSQALPENINKKGQGNPYITPDGKFLFYAKENQNTTNNWSINWVSTKSFIPKGVPE